MRVLHRYWQRMAIKNLQIPVTAESRFVPKWLSAPNFPDKDRFTSSRQDFMLLTPIALKTQKLQNNVVRWVLRSGRGQLTGSTPAVPPATSRATNPRQHRPNDISKPRRDIHLVEIKYCKDTRPQNQLNAAKEQHQGLCNILQGASVALLITLLGKRGTIYNTHTLKPFKELGLDSQRVKKFASKLHVHSVNFAAKLVIPDMPFPVLLSNLISSQFQTKPGFPFPFRGEGALQYSVQKWLIFLN